MDFTSRLWQVIYFIAHALEGHSSIQYIEVTNIWTGVSDGLMAYASKGFGEKVRCQAKCCIFLMGRVKSGLFDL